MNKSKKQSNLLNMWFVFLFAVIAPMTITAVILASVSVSKLRSSLEENVYSRLQACATSVSQYFLYDIEEDILDPTDELSLNFIDSLKSQGIELTLFEGDTRATTSIADASNETGRNIGTTCNADIWASVSKGNVYTADGITIGGENYYVAYVPLTLSDGTVWGMGFAGEKEETVKAAISSLTRTIVILALLVVACCTAIGIAVARLVIKPLKSITETTQELSEGNVAAEINADSHIQEIGALIGAAKTLKENLNSSIGDVKSGAENLGGSIETVAEITRSNAEAVEQISTAIDEVSQTSQSVAESAQVIAGKTDELGSLIDNLSSNVVALGEASSEIDTANHEASNYIETVMDSATKSVNATNDISEKINETNEAVKSIKEAVAVIQDISSQTNLLSLNASIEAARAGEQGRGFAVVAEEIRKLADTSAQSAEEIRQIVGNVMSLSENTVAVAKEVTNIIEQERECIKETQGKFEILSDSISKSNTEIGHIKQTNSMLEDIKSVLVSSTSDLGAISEELGASAEEVSASCTNVAEGCTSALSSTQAMTQEKENLEKSIEFFKL